MLEASPAAWKSLECAICNFKNSKFLNCKMFNVLVIKNLGLNWYPVSDRFHESESENQCCGFVSKFFCLLLFDGTAHCAAEAIFCCPTENSRHLET